MDTGENSQGLRRIMDLTRVISITILLLHFYYIGYEVFDHWKLTSKISDRVLIHIKRTKLLDGEKSKLISLAFLLISVLGSRGRKSEHIRWHTCALLFLIGLIIYFLSDFLFQTSIDKSENFGWFVILSVGGYLLVLSATSLFSRIIKNFSPNDIFNRANETFPQEERLIENEFSVNLPSKFRTRNGYKYGWINLINPMRGTLVCGSPGAGKTHFVIKPLIRQHIEKGYAMFIYDFKYDDLTSYAYRCLQQYKSNYAAEPQFCVINFEDLSRSHRCNPLDPDYMLDISDAAESARTILLGLNRDWIRKQGDFWVESSITLLTSIIWFLKKYNGGEFCTLPHAIEMMQQDYDKLFSVLRSEPEIRNLINPFVSFFENDVMETLEGQMGGTRIALSKLSTPSLYYVMTGNDFSLDINDFGEPKIFCAGNSPQKMQVYGAALGLFLNRMLKTINRQGRQKCAVVVDELSTIRFLNLDTLIATGRSNKIAVTLAIQDLSQLTNEYGREQANVIINTVGNLICGQVTGETAESFAKRFAKIKQDNQSISINTNDTSITKSKQLGESVPASRLNTLSSGEFVGVIADDPKEKIQLKAIDAEILHIENKSLEMSCDNPNIWVTREIKLETINCRYELIKNQVSDLLVDKLKEMLNSPALAGFFVRKQDR